MVARKRDQDTTPAMKALALYSLLLFSGRRYSLSELADLLDCSKPTVLRLIDQIDLTRALHVRIDSEIVNRQRFFWAIQPHQKPNVALDTKAIQDLSLCRDLLANLLPARLRDEIGATIDRTTVLLENFEERDTALASVAIATTKGAVDYSRHQEIIAAILDGIRSQRIVELVYQAHDRPEGRDFAVAPLQLVTHRDSLYLKARREKDLGKKDGFFDPTLAIHRILHATRTDRPYTPPKASTDDDYSVFGFMPGAPFTVLVVAEPTVVPYLRERIWSHDQTIREIGDGRIELRFSASSENEVVSWVLGFAEQMTLIEPAALRERIAACGAGIGAAHRAT